MSLAADFDNIKDIILVPTINDIATNLRVDLKNDMNLTVLKIREKYDMYMSLYKSELEDTINGVLDRHKLSSCICGAIISVQPFTGVKYKGIERACRYPNELLAFWCGLSLLKVFLISDNDFDIIKRNYLMKTFPQLPVTTKEVHGYLACVVYALADIRLKTDNVLHYDFLGNSDRFFHIEQYNNGLADGFINKLKYGKSFKDIV